VKVLIFGASGMVGQGVLQEALRDPDVAEVLSVSRAPLGQSHSKLRERVLPNLAELGTISDQLHGFDAAFFCLGVASAGKTEAEYRALTLDLTVAVGRAVSAANPGSLTFVYVSGAGTDSTEQGPRMWARVKGATENALLRMPFKAAFMFRPALIQPGPGIRSKTPSYRTFYRLIWPLLPLLKRVAPGSVTTTGRVGRAMLRVAKSGGPSQLVSTREINALGA
jgi:uncharacterized protein YbjT (DUF2867 family)